MRKNRFYNEFKFLITPAQKHMLFEKLAHCLKPDEHGHNGLYALKTLYFDTKTLESYQDKLEGEHYKFKLRLRTYESGHKRLEFKLKKANKTGKVRFKNFTDFYQSSPDLILGTELISLTRVGVPFLQEFSNLLEKNFMPTCQVNYLREAYFIDSLHNCRITFDSSIIATSAQSPNLEFPILQDKIVLEIKTMSEVPLFLLQILKSLDITPVNLSKYALSLERVMNL